MWIYAGRLNGYATDIDSAMSMMEAKTQQLGAKLGSRQTLSLSGGQALWAEAQGGGASFYGAVARGGRYYYVYTVKRKFREIKPEDRQGLLSTLQSIRP